MSTQASQNWMCCKLFDAHTHHSPTDRVCAIESIDLYLIPEPIFIPSHRYSVGLHPWNSPKGLNTALKLQLDALSQSELVLAIGECGLDPIRGAHIETQKEIFEFQIELGKQYNKPLIIHSVKANHLLFDVKKKNREQLWIWHGYSGSTKLALEWIRLGGLISIGPKWTHSNKLDIFLRQIPIDKLLLESDELPNRLEDLYGSISQTLNIGFADLVAIQGELFRAVFKTKA